MVRLFVWLNVLLFLCLSGSVTALGQESSGAHFGDGAILLLPDPTHDEYDLNLGHMMRHVEISANGLYAVGTSVDSYQEYAVVANYLWELRLDGFDGTVTNRRPSRIDFDDVEPWFYYAPITISPDDRYAAFATNGTFIFWHPAERGIAHRIALQTLDLERVWSSRWSPDSRYVGVAQGSTVTVLDVDAETRLTRAFDGAIGETIPLEGGWLLLKARNHPSPGTFEVCDVLLETCTRYGDEAGEDVVATPDGSIVYTVRDNNSDRLDIMRWERQPDNTYAATTTGVIGLSMFVEYVSPDGRYISVGDDIWRTSDWEQVGTVANWHSIRFSPDSRYVVVLNGDDLHLYALDPFARIDTLSVPDQLQTDISEIMRDDIRFFGFSPDGEWVSLQVGTFAALIPVDYE